MKYLLAHDLGTTGDKATLFSETGNLVSSSFAAYNTYYPGPGMVEQSAEEWWVAFCRSTEDLIHRTGIDPQSIFAMSISGQMMGMVPVDATGNVLRRPIIWADSRSGKQVRKLESLIGLEEIYSITGTRTTPTYQGFKIAWLKDNEPEAYRRTYKFLQAKDFINMRLCGRFVTDQSDAVMTNLFDINSLSWSSRIIDALGIDREKLPEIVSSTQNLGSLRPDVAQYLGLPRECRVIAGAGDGCSAAVGAGAVEKGDAYLHLGSSSWISVISDNPPQDSLMRIFTGAHAVEGLYFPSGTMQAAGASYGWIKDMLYHAEEADRWEKNENVFDYMDRILMDTARHREPILYLPYLLGERSPVWNSDARGTFIGLSASHRRVDLVRAVIEGVCMNLKWILDTLESFVTIDELRLTGGGARSKNWRRIIPDVLGKTIRVPDNVEESSSMGAAIIAGVGSGLFDFSQTKRFLKDDEIIEPKPERHEAYMDLYGLFKESYELLKPVYEGLSELRNDDSEATKI